MSCQVVPPLVLTCHFAVVAPVSVAVSVAVELVPQELKLVAISTVGGGVGQIKFDTVIQPAGDMEATR